MKKKYKKHKNIILKLSIKKYFFIILFISYFLLFHLTNYNDKFHKDDLTIVSAYYKMKSKHSSEQYLEWISNFVLLNKSLVFFTSKEFMPIIKKLRPKELYYKTKFIELEIEDFYTYKNFYIEFNETYKIDIENSYHSVPLYMIWAEKSTFLKKAIYKNYFHSKCFYWVDAGYFREKKIEMKKYINNWPSTKKCFEDKRLLMGQVKYFSDSFKQKLINFDKEAHYKLQKSINVIGGILGGQIENTLKFTDLYYNSIKLFIKHKIFIGKDQNIYTFVAFSNPKIINLVFFRTYDGFKQYLG